MICNGFRSRILNALPAMSEYQYYEFQAIDRPLTADEMATLRQYSTRARITPTSFVNEYNWGDSAGFQMQLAAFRGTHARKPSLLARLQQAGL